MESNRLILICRDDERIGCWFFQCSCGNVKSIRKSSVDRGVTRSCGCLHRERAKSGLNPLKHGQARNGQVTRLHNIWRGMLKRVDATKGCAFEKYASRGIKVCVEWRNFEPFRDWANAHGYSDNLTIDRIDNDKGYAPENCQWVGWKTQARNRRSSRKIVAFGETKTLAEWSEISGLKAETISARISLLWTSEDAVTKPLRKAEK